MGPGSNGETPLNFTTKCLFSPLMILLVLGLNRLIFAPCFALKRATPFPANISPGEMDANFTLNRGKGIGHPKKAGGPCCPTQKEGDTDPATGYRVFVGQGEVATGLSLGPTLAWVQQHLVCL